MTPTSLLLSVTTLIIVTYYDDHVPLLQPLNVCLPTISYIIREKAGTDEYISSSVVVAGASQWRGKVWT